MNRSSILNEAYEWLRYKKLVSSKKEFAEHIGIDKTNLSSAFNGMEKYLTDNLFIKISEAFPQLNKNWLLTGKGNVQKAQSVSTDFENTNQQSENMNANDFLKALAEEHRTMVFYESPHRLLKTLTQFAEYFGTERQATVSREISKLHEETVRGSLAELIEHFTATEPRGEIVIVLAGIDD